MMCTLFRAPILILELMTKMSKPRIGNDDPIHFKIYHCVLEFPLKGKPLLHIKAKKETDFTFNAGKCKVFVLGTRLWNAISDVFGSSMSTAGQSMLPNKLWNEHGMDYSHISNNNTQRIQTTIELQTPLIERSTVLYNTQKLSANIEFVMQIEHESRGILFILLLKMSDFIRCAQSGNGKCELANTCFANLDQNKINEIRGTEFMGLIDSFYIIVGMQFMKFCNDIIHLILFLLLLLIPWRFIKCVKKLLKTKYEYNARENEKAISRLEYLIIIWNKLWLKLFEPMLNDIVKTESNVLRNNSVPYHFGGAYRINNNRASLFAKWANNIERDWIEYQQHYITEDKICMKLTTYDTIAKGIDAKLSAISPIPVTKAFIFDFLDLQNILLYLKIMQSTTDILAMKEKLSWHYYAIFSEQLQVKIDYFQKQMFLLHCMIHNTHNQMEYAANAKSKHVSCAIFKKSLSLNYKIIHDSLRKGLVDIAIILPFLIIAIGLILYFVLDYHKIWPMIAIVVLLLLLTLYRIIPLVVATYNLSKLRKRMKRGNPNNVLIVTRFGFRQILDFQLRELWSDIKLLLFCTFLSLLIIITLVRFFEYVSKLINYQRMNGKKLNLHYAVNVGKEEVREIWRHIIDLFNFIFMWKTYKFAISALAFGLFLPAAGFLEIFAFLFKNFMPRKIRQILSMILWFGSVSAIIYVTTSMDSNTTYYYLFCLITVGIVILFYIALFIVGEYDEETLDVHRPMLVEQRVRIYVDSKILLWSYPNAEYTASYIRFSWPNVLTICALFFDAFQMVSILFYTFSISSNSAFNTPLNDNIFKHMVTMSEYVLLMNINGTTFKVLSIVFLLIGFLWLVIISLPLVVEELFHFAKSDTFIHSHIWIKATWIYSKIFFIFLLINWIKLFQCIPDNENNASKCMVISSNNSYNFGSISIISLIIIIYFWFTSSIILVYKSIKIRHSKTDNLDIKYPLAFIHCLQIFQSLFVICGMLMILKNDNVKNAFLICCILSIIMLLWHFLYPFISKQMIGDYYNFSSIKHFVCIQIMCYLIIAYVSVVLYFYVEDVVENNIGAIILYGSLGIAVIGLLIAFIINIIIYNDRIKKLHESELQTVLNSLSDLYEKTSINGAVGEWFQTIGKNKILSFTKNKYSAPNDLSYLLIEFEKNILFQRLIPNFVLNKRDLWIQKVLKTRNFNDFIPLINELLNSIVSPPYFTLCIKTLSEECHLLQNAPKVICFLIMQFVVDCKGIVQMANESLLHPNSFPKYDIKDNIIQRIFIFAQQCDKHLESFIDALNQIKNSRKREI